MALVRVLSALVKLAVAAIVLVIAAAAVLYVIDEDRPGTFTRDVIDFADDNLVYTRRLIELDNNDIQLPLNYAISALGWIVVGAILVALLGLLARALRTRGARRESAARDQARGERERSPAAEGVDERPFTKPRRPEPAPPTAAVPAVREWKTEPVVDERRPEPVVEERPPEPVAEARPPEPVAEARPPEPVAEERIEPVAQDPPAADERRELFTEERPAPPEPPTEIRPADDADGQGGDQGAVSRALGAFGLGKGRRR